VRKGEGRGNLRFGGIVPGGGEAPKKKKKKKLEWNRKKKNVSLQARDRQGPFIWD